MKQDPPVLPRVRGIFRAVAQRVVPESTELGEAGWRELEAIVEQALAMRPPRMRRQLALFLRIVNIAPFLRHGRPFTALPAAKRDAVLRGFEDSGVLLLRRGFWGVRTLVYMGYYARPAAHAEIGYRASTRGWGSR